MVGPAHSGWGLEVPTSELPNYVVPPFSGIGANEYLVDVTHEVPGPDGTPIRAVDFLSTVDTPYVWELNIWYHTLNCGYRTRISGETDFPCIYGERVGLGRSYVKLAGKLDFDAWCEGIRQGRNYVGDGRSHLMDLQVGEVAVGENGSELRLPQAGRVKVKVRAAARLSEKPDPALHAALRKNLERNGATNAAGQTAIVESLAAADNVQPVRQRPRRIGTPLQTLWTVALTIAILATLEVLIDIDRPLHLAFDWIKAHHP